MPFKFRSPRNFTVLARTSFLAFALSQACMPKVAPTKAASSEQLSGDTAPKAPAFNPDDVVFGPELEFTDPKTGDLGYSSTYRTKFFERVMELCEKDKANVVCTQENDSVEIKSLRGNGRIKAFPYMDPAVLEIPLEPMTVRQAEESRDLIQKYIFDAAADIGLSPGTKQYNRWCAHTNFSWPGLRSGEHGELFLRYFADWQSNPALGMGAFSGDIRNAPVLAMSDDATQQKLGRIVDDWNSGNKQGAFEIAERIRNEVYSTSTGLEYVYSSRYNAFNLTHLQGSASAKKNYATSAVRLEQRASYMPLSADHLISNYKVITGRLSHLNKQAGAQIKYAPVKLAALPGARRMAFNGVQEGVEPAQVAKAYVEYLDEAGLDKEYHIKHMMNPVVQEEAAKIAGIDLKVIQAIQAKAASLLKTDVKEYVAKAVTFAK